MKVILLAVLMSAVITGGAFAAQTTGTITGISKKSDTITLSGGKRFHLPEGIEVESLNAGNNVKVSYTVGAGHQREVSAVHSVQ